MGGRCRAHLAAAILLALAAVAPRTVDAAALLAVADDGGAPPVARDHLAAALSDRGVVAWDDRALLDALGTRIVFAPDPDRDAAFVARTADNATGRNLYFESRFAEADEILASGLAAVEAYPAVLAFHPDLAPGAFDAALTLARARAAAGDGEGAREAMEAAATLMWTAEPSTSEFPPGFIAEYEQARALVPTREVTLRWRGGRSCEVRIDGFAARLNPLGDYDAGGTIRLPAGDHHVELSCESGRSHVHRLDGRSAAMEIDLAFDDAVTLVDGRIVFRPRDRTPALLDRLSAHAAALVGGPVFTAADIGGAEGTALEFTRWADGHDGFRAVRVALDDERPDVRVAAAVDYLLTGDATGGITVWDSAAGWPAPEGGARPPSIAAWTAGGVASVAFATAAIFEARVAESRGDIDACADTAVSGCDPSVLPSLRSDARTARAWANAAWAVGGAGVVAAVLASTLRRDGDGGLDAGAALGRGGAWVGVGWSW